MSEENKNLNTSASEAQEKEALDLSGAAVDSAAKAKEPEKSGTEDKNKKKKKEGKIKSFMKSRKAKHGSIAIVIVAVVVAITIVINVICGLLVDRFPNLKLDLTANNAFELQEDTLNYVSDLEQDVTVNVLATQSDFENNGTYFIQAENLLEKMESASDGKLGIKYVDLSSNPSFATQYPNVNWNSQVSNIILVSSGEQYKALTLDDCFEYDSQYYAYYGSYQFTGTKIEQAVVTAILNVTTENKVVVDMIKGNGEQDYSAITSLLENNAYQVNEVSLATNGMDDDAEFAILYAPSVDLDDSAIDKLSTWLDNGGNNGKTLIYVPCADKADTPNLDKLLSDWGMQVNGGYVFETSNDYLVSSSSPYAFIVDYADYYTDNLKNSKIPVVTSDTHDIIIKDESTAHALLTTSSKAGVYPYDADEDWSYSDAISGDPLNVAAEGVKTNSDDVSSNVVVFGSYMMFTKNLMEINSFNNSAYLMNVVNTLAEKDDVGITIESKSLDSAELGVTDVTPGLVVLVIFVFVIPIGILVAGIIVWIRRRNR